MYLRLLLFFVLTFPAAHAGDMSETLFAHHRNSVFQIQLIDTSANQKAVIGSGFRVGSTGNLVATNYHVISEKVYEKERYRIEAVDDNNRHHTMALRAVDVIHDLALLEFSASGNEPIPAYTPFAINSSEMQQGQNVFSLGNPHDIGMMIVSGEYNGPVKDSRFQRLIFSGDINAGMSGGPAINERGEVVGINVASHGDGIGYLVPASYLQALLEDLPQQQQKAREAVVGAQLLADQDAFYQQILASPWKTQEFADLTLPGELHRSIKCWGDSEEVKDRRYDSSSMRCSNNNDYLFILNGKYTGFIEYSYEWSREIDLNRFQLYSLVEEQNKFGSYAFYDFDNSWTKDEVTPHQCETSFVKSGGGTWRMIYCVRAIKLFPGLFDVGLMMVSADRNDRNLSAELTVTGISSANATRLTEQFIRSVTWTR